ncbi:hypothetical protein EDD21DRAFT_377094 [Dissophora ornata]|nr:hypothetical protein EDD21DRAFT_377094 [Dissophora ornata]
MLLVPVIFKVLIVLGIIADIVVTVTYHHARQRNSAADSSFAQTWPGLAAIILGGTALAIWLRCLQGSSCWASHSGTRTWSSGGIRKILKTVSFAFIVVVMQTFAILRWRRLVVRSLCRSVS